MTPEVVVLAVRDVFVLVVVFPARAMAPVFVCRDPLGGSARHGAVLVCEGDAFGADTGAAAVCATLAGAADGETGANGRSGFDPVG